MSPGCDGCETVALFISTESAKLGNLPDSGRIATLKLPTFSGGDPKPTATANSGDAGGSKAATPVGNQATTKKATSSDTLPFTLGEGLPPVPAKLASKIRRGEYVDMAELLRDNMELERRRDTREVSSNAFGLNQQPNRREVPDLLSWVQCFGMYAAVLSSSYPERVQELYAYQTMIVREARRCGGKGWLSYDQMFRQHAAVRATDWSKLNNSLYATTFLQQQNGRGRTCVHCMETNHVSNDCSLAPVRPGRLPSQSRTEFSADSDEKGNKGRSSKICYSWNDGRCAIGPYCRYRHICAKCGSNAHKAMHCTAYPSTRQPLKPGSQKE